MAEKADKRYCRQGPCESCPFSKLVPPGETGGSDPTIYVGQAYGPFLLSCHEDPDYSKNRASTELIQCGGAAIFRANIGVTSLLPPFFHRLGRSKRVFADPAELLEHHLQITREEAEALLEETPPMKLLQIEMNKIRPGMIKQVPRENR